MSADRRGDSRVGDAIRQRPPQEPPFLAVQRTIIAFAREIAQDRRGKPIWLFTNQPRPYELLLKSAPKPLLKFEDAITNAILDRTSERGDSEAEFAEQLIARVSIAILRSAAIRQRELETTPGSNAPKIDATLEAAYATIALQMRADGVH